jgi:hypothetical protein
VANSTVKTNTTPDDCTRVMLAKESKAGISRTKMAMQTTMIFATRAIWRQEKRHVSSSSLSSFCFLKPSIVCKWPIRRRFFHLYYEF